MPTGASVLNFPESEGNRISHLGVGVRIQGKIFSDQDLQVDGEVDGTLEVTGHNLTVGAKAKVKAEIKAQNITIIGGVEGSVEATGILQREYRGNPAQFSSCHPLNRTRCD